MTDILGNQTRLERMFTGADLGNGTIAPAVVLRGNYNLRGFTVNDDSVVNLPLPLGWVYGSSIQVWVDWLINEALAPGNKNIQWRLIYEGLLPDSNVAIGAGPVSGQIDTGDILIPATALSVRRSLIATITDVDLEEAMDLGLRLRRIAAVGGAPAAEPEVLAIRVMMAVQTLNYKV